MAYVLRARRWRTPVPRRRTSDPRAWRALDRIGAQWLTSPDRCHTVPQVTTPSQRASEERQLALLVSSALDYAIFMLDPEGHILTWNAGAERIKGYTHDEIVGQHFSVFYTDEDRARDHPAEELALALEHGRYEEEGWRLRKDGSRFWASVTITAIRDGDGALVGFGKISRDLTTRRMHEDQLRAKTAELEAANAQLGEFRRLVASVRDYAIFMLDPGGHIRSWNAGAQKLKGYEPEEIIGRHFSVFYSAEDRARRHPEYELEVAVREGRYEEEGWRVRKDGTRFWASVTITAVRDEAGNLTSFAKVTRDLTARRETEQELQRAVEELRAANAELDRFAAIAAHDLTDPLRTISGFAELLERGDLPLAERQYAEHIRASSLRLTRMLRGLLTYARAGKATEDAEAVVLAEAAGHVLDDLAGPISERGADITVLLPVEAAVVATASDVRLLLQNLVSNAVKFADRGAPAVTIAGERRDGTWRVTVEDNGAGVPEADRERIFGAFERAHADREKAGYGLGLAICRRVVDRHGGALGLEEGSRFWFTLPAGVAPHEELAGP
jgi:PAS domain S-box-containing protein